MKLAYLIHTQDMNNETVRVIRALADKGNHIFIMINNKDNRNEAFIELSTYPTIHIEQDIEYASAGDLSLARYYLYKIRELLDKYDFNYFISLDNGMTPLQSDEMIRSFFETHYPANFYRLFDSCSDKYIRRYYPFTNFTSFDTSNLTRGWSRSIAFILNLFGIRRPIIDDLVVGSQYFAISDQGARQLINNIDFLFENFKLSWYPEQTALPTMFNKFMTQTHLNTPIFYLGPTGQPTQWRKASLVSEPIPTNHSYLFGGPFTLDEIKEHLKTYKAPTSEN